MPKPVPWPEVEVRRLVPEDGREVSKFLVAEYKADPSSGVDNPDRVTPDYMEMVIEGSDSWGAWIKKRLVGVITCYVNALVSGDLSPDGEPHSATFYNRLVVDTRTTDDGQRREVARALCAQSVDELRAAGRMGECVWVYGPTTCRGATWSRSALRMKETYKGELSDFVGFTDDIRDILRKMVG